MVMTEGEICREYRAAKNKKYQITILADQNCCKEEEIRKILIGNGIELLQNKQKMPEQKDTKAVKEEKAKEEPPRKEKNMPDAVMRVLFARMDVLDAEIAVLEKEYKEIAAFVGHYGGERSKS